MFVLIWLTIYLFVISWTYKARPEKKMLLKYPYQLRHRIHLPFIGRYWNKKIDQEDLIKIKRYQDRINVMFLTIIIPFLGIHSYFLINSYLDYQTLIEIGRAHV